MEQRPYPSLLKFLEPYALKLGGSFGSLGTQKTPTVLYNVGGAATAFEYIVENGALYIKNTTLNKAIWVRLARHSSKEFIAFSNGDNIETAFRTFIHTAGFSNFHFNRILDILDLNANTEVKDQLFGPTYTVTPMIAFLKTTIGRISKISTY